MSVKAVTYYTVECDEPGCGRDLSDLGSDYSAWADAGVAADEWVTMDGLALEDKMLCPTHAADYLWCDECGDERTTLRDADDNPLCESCAKSGGAA